jgi:NAD(P)-dependent dehydrogenase (short-subunit alcohol dehydrogenase family)
MVVMITGASAGVGRATACAFARRGACIGLLARGAAGLAGARTDVERLGGQALVTIADVADPEGLERAADELEAAFGPIDVWVNNAMASVFSPVRDMTPAEFRRVTEVTYLGTVYGTMTALRRMAPRNRGAIIQVGSALAYRGIPLQSAYCAAKHAVQGFCDSLRTELLRDRSGVRMTMVQLPALNTPQFDWTKSRLPRRGQPVPPIFQPEVAAHAIVWAASQNRREVYVGAPTTQAIVANKLAPGLVDRFLARTGFDAQQTQEPEDPDRPHNLWEPMDRERDFGARGRFGESARSTSWQFWLSRQRGVVTVASALVGLTLLALSRPGQPEQTRRTGPQSPPDPARHPDDTPSEPDEIPDTPPTEPPPVPIEDPRPEGTPPGPYIAQERPT